MSRSRSLAIGALILLLAATPFIPRGDDEDGAIVPSGRGAYVARDAGGVGYGRVTPDLQAEIDRVVEGGLEAGRVLTRVGKVSVTQLAQALVRCADLEGQRYCLGTGWTEATQAEVQGQVAVAARSTLARAGSVETTGDLDAVAALRRLAAMSPLERARAEREELVAAARSVAKVWMLRHEIEGVPLPADFLARHPEARALPGAAALARPVAGRDKKPTAKPTTKPSATPTPSPSPTRKPSKSPSSSPSKSPSPTSTPSPTKSPTKGPSAAPTSPGPKTAADYPQRGSVLDPSQVADQIRTYWCGPTTMQMITWGWKQQDWGAEHWAEALGTTSSGTAITDMVRVVNNNTGYDDPDHAGPYVVVDIAQYDFAEWMTLMMKHIVDYQAPVVLHPILLKKYYPYLDDDASGHFQVGRGYAKRDDKPVLLGYFEPWNQQRFDPSEPYISRVQWRPAYKSFRANQAHFQHNIGV
ncbi:MAG: hypothetical protein F2667_02835 [Actinobacteria bacterium]|uniref:Unannotated protein n=1 Tax=freshwater metagenome TaxID=449393 RepID=A0A6J6P9H9_9ZZZZ|nr:hypothetical protein [Actinomycetota bacterium]